MAHEDEKLQNAVLDNLRSFAQRVYKNHIIKPSEVLSYIFSYDLVFLVLP